MTAKLDHNQNLDVLEKMIDENTVVDVLDLFAEVCSAKADHIRTNWQDETLAQAWDIAAARILNCRYSFGQADDIVQSVLLTGSDRNPTVKS